MKRLLSLAAGFVLGGLTTAQFSVSLDGFQATPPSFSSATGTAKVKLEPSTGAISVAGSYTGLAGSISAVHIHGPAAPGTPGPIVFVLAHTGGAGGTFSGVGTIGPAAVKDMLSGLHYINVHSTVFASGEIRGQIIPNYGDGNPRFSLTVASGAPKIGTVLTLGVNNPLGTQSAGSLSFVAIALAQDPLFLATGKGISIPGWGMAGGAGELLVSVLPPNPILSLAGPPWSGGSPAPIGVAIPLDPGLVGVIVFAQGLLLDPVGPQTFGLTDGLVLPIAP